MRLIMRLMVAAGLLIFHGWAIADAIFTSSSVSVSSSQSGTSSEASFTGHDGRHIVNGDIVEIRQGRLAVNGVAYGTVKPGSFIRYRIQGDKKTLVVDGKALPLHR